MNESMQITQHGRPKFVPPTVSDYSKGRKLYINGKDFADCTSADMQAGYTAAAGKCQDDYWLAMMRQAVN